MVNVRYSPKLRFGFLKKKRIVLIKKKTQALKKKKWYLYISIYCIKSKLFEPLFRKDIHQCKETKKKKSKCSRELQKDYTRTFYKRRPFKLQKDYTNTFFSIRQLTSYLILKSKFLRNIFLRLFKVTKKVSAKTLFNFTEIRLDVLLLRTNFVNSLHSARWLISSGYVLLNEITFYVASYRVNITR